MIYDAERHEPLMVLDTKYQRPDTPSTADVAQAVAYAESKGVKTAALIYPEPLPAVMNIVAGGTRVETLDFDLTVGLEASGAAFLGALVKLLDVT